MKRSSHHIIIPILAIVLLAVSSCFKNDTGIPSIRDFEELIRRVPVSGVRLNVTARTLNVGDTYTLTPTVTPSNATEKGVSWTSSNTGVATVDQGGKVTALKEGSAIITAKTTDGGYTATCSVTVKPAEIIDGAVDLGLSVQWASCNLGASRPEEYGGYYQWAGTQDVTSTSIYLDWSNGPYHTGSSYLTGWTKYNTESSYGTVDNKTVLDPDDDVAHVKLGGSWRMPTEAEWNELIEDCTWTWITQNGIKGYKVMSKKSGYSGKSIFLPAAGSRYHEHLLRVGFDGDYWSSSLMVDDPSGAYEVEFDSLAVGGHGTGRIPSGQSIRPVYGEKGNIPVSGIKLNRINITLTVGDTYTLASTVFPSNATDKSVTWSSDNTGVATVDQNGKVTAVNAGSVIITVKTTDGSRTATCSVTVKSLEIVAPEVVDLGLKVKWANWNLGASKPEEYGGYYQWAGTRDVTSMIINLDWDNCPYHTGTIVNTGWTKYIPSDKTSYWSGAGSPDDKTVLDPDDDVAHVKLGGSWRMPTNAEWKDLIDNCTWIWTTENGVNGYKVTSNMSGYTDKSIFLPAAGYRSGDDNPAAGSYGFYWSSLLYTRGLPFNAYNLDFYSYSVNTDYIFRNQGLSVRPVYAEQKIPVSGVRLNKTNIILNVGDSNTLKAIITPSDATEKGVSWVSSNTGVATVDQNGIVTAVKDGNATITVQTTEGGYSATCDVMVRTTKIVTPEAVNLGLSVKWANLNLGASKPEEYGGYFQWAGTQDVSSSSKYIDLNNCPYHTGTSSSTGWTKYIPSDMASYWSGAGSPDNKTLLDIDDDVAHVKLGDKWRTPTDEEWAELRNNCTWTWTTENGVNGYKVTSNKSGYTDKSIFLPAAGCRDNDVLSGAGSSGIYWCSSLYIDKPYRAHCANFNSYNAYKSHDNRYCGLSVRPVTE